MYLTLREQDPHDCSGVALCKSQVVEQLGLVQSLGFWFLQVVQAHSALCYGAV